MKLEDEKLTVSISINGCDAITEFDLVVSKEELAFLEKLSAKSEECSTYGCMPTMSVITP